MRSTAIDRRRLLAGAGAALTCGLAPRAAEALARAEEVLLAPCRAANGDYAVLVLSESGETIREVALPARGHDLAIDAVHGRAVAFARRPGTFAVAFDITGRIEPQVLLSPADRHFFGHGAVSADGRLLFATENDFKAGRGVIGVYDASGGYRRIGEFPCHGIGTHEAILLPDGRTLAVANGGIETHPAYGRDMLNLATMEPSFCFVEAATGDLLARYDLGPRLRHLSIRHMAIAADGQIWFGAQWEGDPMETPSLVGRASLDEGIALTETPAPQLHAMQRYVGAMAASRDGSVICASAPRGGLIAYWSAETGKMLGATAFADSSGIAGFSADTFLASNGEGRIVEAGPHNAPPGRLAADMPGVAFDNHLRLGGRS
jgi:hypothetical protein